MVFILSCEAGHAMQFTGWYHGKKGQYRAEEKCLFVDTLRLSMNQSFVIGCA
jgi:hypothetical protein